MLSWLHCSFH